MQFLLGSLEVKCFIRAPVSKIDLCHVTCQLKPK